MCSGVNGAGPLSLASWHILLFHGDPRQSCGDSRGAKHVRILLIEVKEEQICCLCWLVRKLCWVKHLNRQC